MPFGLDLKSMVVGGLLVWFVVPLVIGMLGHKKA